ncbi:ATP-binding cassette domain-containing protein [Thermomonospora umbrina]|uniref:Monosaccharide ABC transporter ATP-binding protein (CUT2 family) n=1 Tax=Thermomonospora umbrina TaxID=111806 RepID=A0A3D9SZN9_9ACTN|nr:ATP-binding cassette domain-containing protein [Thermomonospora umbrina]REF00031.1 monosaccharide ABC transporter ATP-binding protein (CUT2 family) [Thermomonospora umbrina]
MSVTPVLDLRGVDESLGPVQVLHDVALSAYAGEVTALVGDNGAGRSTPVKCLGGILPRDSGHHLFEGRPVRVGSPREAAALGIEIVHQDVGLRENLDVVQDMVPGRERRGGPVLDEAEMQEPAARALTGPSVRTITSVRQPVGDLWGGQRQSVAIARAMLWGGKVVVLGEPTAALGVAQTRRVPEVVRRPADKGRAVVLISHDMNDVFADRICAPFLGRAVARVRASDVTHAQVVEPITSGRGGAEPRGDGVRRVNGSGPG